MKNHSFFKQFIYMMGAEHPDWDLLSWKPGSKIPAVESWAEQMFCPTMIFNAAAFEDHIEINEGYWNGQWPSHRDPYALDPGYIKRNHIFYLYPDRIEINLGWEDWGNPNKNISIKNKEEINKLISSSIINMKGRTDETIKRWVEYVQC